MPVCRLLLRVAAVFINTLLMSLVFGQTVYATRDAFRKAFPSPQALRLTGRVGSEYEINWRFGNGTGYSTAGPIAIDGFTFTGNTYGTLTETYLIDNADFAFNGTSMILGGRNYLDIQFPPNTWSFGADVGLSTAQIGNRSLTFAVQLAKGGWQTVSTIPTPDGSPRFIGYSNSGDSIVSVRLSTNFAGLGGFVGINGIEVGGLGIVPAAPKANDHFVLEPSNLRLNLQDLPASFRRSSNPNTKPVYGGSLWYSYSKLVITGRPNQKVRLLVIPTPMSGFHDHDDNKRRRGWILDSGNFDAVDVGPKSKPGAFPQFSDEANAKEVVLDPKGKAYLLYVAPEIAGVETIRCEDWAEPSINATAIFDILLSGLEPFSSPDVEPIQNSDYHKANQFGTPEMNAAMALLAKVYKAQKGKTLKVNDMSLEAGGLFDIGPPSFPWWSVSHIGHKLGMEADINGFGYPNDFFEALLADQGIWIKAKEASHYHIAFNGKPTQVGLRFVNSRSLPLTDTDKVKSVWDSQKGTYRLNLTLMNTGSADASELSAVWSASPADDVRFITKGPLKMDSLPVAVTVPVSLEFTSKLKKGSFLLTIRFTASRAQGSAKTITRLMSVTYNR